PRAEAGRGRPVARGAGCHPRRPVGGGRLDPVGAALAPDRDLAPDGGRADRQPQKLAGRGVVGARTALRARRHLPGLAVLRRATAGGATLRVRTARARAQVLLRRALRRALLPPDRLGREGL